VTTLASALDVLGRELSSAGVPYMVIGGVANLVWGEPRTTMDVDVTVDVASIGIEAFVQVAARCGVPRAPEPVAFAVRTRVVPVRTPEGIPIDFIVAALPFEVEAIGRALLIDFEDLEIRVCSPEDLIIHKIVSDRPRDLEDVVGVLRRRRHTLDLVRLDETVKELARGLEEPAILARYQEALGATGL